MKIILDRLSRFMTDNLLLNIGRLPGIIRRTIRNLNVQKKFLASHIEPELEGYKQNNDGSLRDPDFRKITGYYGLAVPAILGESFCRLHGRKLSLKERWCCTGQGSMTGLFDDFFDLRKLDDKDIEKKIEGEPVAVAMHEKLFNFFFNMAKENAPNRQAMLEALRAVHKAQVKSKIQESHSTEPEAIKNVTFEKGGYSLLFYRTAIDAPLSPREKQLIYATGALMQLCNDIFDIYKDRETGVQTLATKSTSINSLNEIFKTELKAIKYQLRELPLPEKHKREFIQLITLAVFSRTSVCLRQLQKIEKKTGNLDIASLSRRELICDMDKLSNKLRSAWYCARLCDL